MKERNPSRRFLEHGLELRRQAAGKVGLQEAYYFAQPTGNNKSLVWRMQVDDRARPNSAALSHRPGIALRAKGLLLPLRGCMELVTGLSPVGRAVLVASQTEVTYRDQSTHALFTAVDPNSRLFFRADRVPNKKPHKASNGPSNPERDWPYRGTVKKLTDEGVTTIHPSALPTFNPSSVEENIGRVDGRAARARMEHFFQLRLEHLIPPVKDAVLPYIHTPEEVFYPPDRGL